MESGARGSQATLREATMSGFQLLVKSYKSGASTSINLRNKTTGVITASGGDCRSDTLELAHEAQGIHANADGTVTLVDGDGNEAAFTVAAGVSYPYRVRQVKATGTTLAADEFNLLYQPY